MRLVAIGGSAGAIDALRLVLHPIPADVRAGFVVVVHIPATTPSLLAEVIATHSALPVREAFDKQPLEPGVVVVAPPDYHLLVERELTLALSRDAPVRFSRPSIDPMFESVADAAGPRAIGILLTGANQDGAAGLAAIQAAGGLVAVQDPTTARATEMPMAGIAAVAPDLVGDPAALGRWLATLLAVREPA